MSRKVVAAALMAPFALAVLAILFLWIRTLPAIVHLAVLASIVVISMFLYGCGLWGAPPKPKV